MDREAKENFGELQSIQQFYGNLIINNHYILYGELP